MLKIVKANKSVNDKYFRHLKVEFFLNDLCEKMTKLSVLLNNPIKITIILITIRIKFEKLFKYIFAAKYIIRNTD